ncbi:hypothetical protein ABZ070_33320 [Streptomyces sp. NPDC006283]|uniref:hypothetical protein n=1 Tax=Streptomyces sp. NPDC006283 TaxID=3156741 RepID=UPI00339F2D5D
MIQTRGRPKGNGGPPLARFLRRCGWPPALAASVVTVTFLLVAAGTRYGRMNL